MNEELVLEKINKFFFQIFKEENPYTLKEIKEKIAFDIKLPKQVTDFITGESTWADSLHNKKYITQNNMIRREKAKGWMLPKQEIHSLQELMLLWNKINLMTTERVYESLNVSKSDTIYRCENIYQSTNCQDSKNLIFCDSCSNSNNLLACQRSDSCNYCIRTDDSYACSNSYIIQCSNKINQSLFIQDCSNLFECILCSHISNQRYCIANMPFEKEEYEKIKKEIIKWILNS